MLDIHGNSGEPWRPCGLSHSHFSFAPRIRGAPMLTFMGFMTIAVVLVLLLSNRVGAVVALIGVPVIAAFLLGFGPRDRKSTRLNSSHVSISYAVICLKKK